MSAKSNQVGGGGERMVKGLKEDENGKRRASVLSLGLS